jgi:molecular chaperone DnaJ
MDTEDAYAELGLPPGASDTELKAAWRRLVARWHPDRNRRPEAPARMQRINLAYLAIRQAREAPAGADEPAPPQARTAPSRAGRRRAGAPGARTGRTRAAGRGDSAADPDPPPGDAADATADAAQAGAAPRTVRRKLRLTLEEAALGCTRTVSGRCTLRCAACAGHGWLAQEGACGGCAGSGTVRRGSLFGWLATSEPCAACGGEGRARQPCADCGQRGRRSAAYRRSVRLPPGVRAGDVLTAPAGRHGGAELVLELLLEIEPHAIFTLDDDGTLRCEVPVDGYAWMGNAWVEVPTPSGLQAMRLRREHRSYRLRGQGFPRERRGERADLLVEIRPCFPDEPSAAQQALLDRLVAEGAASPQQPLADWQDRLRDWAARRPSPPG